MKTRLIPAEAWRDALELLAAGRVIGMPTDTVYGVAAMPLDAGAIDAIYEAKDMPVEKALPMLVGSVPDAEHIAELSGDALRLCHAFWPGALTVVAPAAAAFQSPALADDGTVAVRMPALDLALRIIAAAGGVLAVTSANRSGSPPATTAAEVLAQLDGRIAAVIDGGLSRGGTPSSVVRVVAGRFEVLREGAIAAQDLWRAIQD